jgi:hypothetical protein
MVSCRKGVLIIHDLAEAKEVTKHVSSQKFGAAVQK